MNNKTEINDKILCKTSAQEKFWNL